MSDVLVDSSAWIDFFRGAKEAVRRIDPLLADDRAATTAIIAAEVVSGARTRAVFDELRDPFAALPTPPGPADLWERVVETRFGLARRGFRCHLVDLAIAHAAAYARQRLLTRDRDFETIAAALGFELELF
jgi:predicted nucleic acid-binding protein